MSCNECSFFKPESVWESKAKIEGKLGANSPILDGGFQFSTRDVNHPLSFITKEMCENCDKCVMKAYESVYQNNKIAFTCVSFKEIEVKDAKKKNIIFRYGRNIFPKKLPEGPYVDVIGERGNYRFEDEPQRIKDTALVLLKELLTFEKFLTEAQANIVAKSKLGWKLKKSTERNTKSQFVKKLRGIEKYVEYWEDLEEFL